jgi:acetyltransferase-like isoleucine patch superfamily enzyme
VRKLLQVMYESRRLVELCEHHEQQAKENAGNPQASIRPLTHGGNNYLYFQQVTSDPRDSGVPRIEEHVNIGTIARTLGEVTVGRHDKIGANAVLRDVPAGATSIGVPVKITLECTMRPFYARSNL